MFEAISKSQDNIWCGETHESDDLFKSYLTVYINIFDVENCINFSTRMILSISFKSCSEIRLSKSITICVNQVSAGIKQYKKTVDMAGIELE